MEMIRIKNNALIKHFWHLEKYLICSFEKDKLQESLINNQTIEIEGSKIKSIMASQPGSDSGIRGMGKFPFWGLSPAQDLLSYIGKSNLNAVSNVRILLVGQVDMRHVLKTVSDNLELLKSENVVLEVYIAEDRLEQLARQLLFWELATESDLGLIEKASQFMELYGNTFIRPQTKESLIKKLVPRLIKTLTEEAKEDPCSRTSENILDFSDMKYREKDDLIQLIKHWAKPVESNSYSMEKDWNQRVSLHLGTRYNSKFNMFDWDYQMKLMDRGAGIVSKKEYENWRNTGVAFINFDSDYSQPNVTLASVMFDRFGTIKMNYVGEIVTGSFIAYGIEANDEKFYEKINDQYKKNSYDITQHNLQTIFTNLNQAKEENLLEKVVKLHFISPSNFGKMWMKSKYTESKFHLVYFGNTMVQHMQPTICEILVENARILVENAYLALEFRKDQIELFDEKVGELADKMKLAKLESLCTDAKKEKVGLNTFINYVYSPETETLSEKAGIESSISSQINSKFMDNAEPKIEEISNELESMKMCGDSDNASEVEEA